ncbi:MAG TPA: DUF1572 family protein [Puia sp.]|jgi:hypothetical protein|nr:DUF1572 family protein [Puia sp.]
MSSLGAIYLDSAIKRLLTYKHLGEKTFAQLEEKDFHYTPNTESNSISVIIRHLHGNMLSRWTNFLTEDGEKESRNRDTEFNPPAMGKTALLDLWEEGWTCLLDTLRSLRDEDLLRTITIRHEPLIVIDAINRQLAHYPHHVGQIVYIGKMIRNEKWQNLSIPKGASAAFNRQMKEEHPGDGQ